MKQDKTNEHKIKTILRSCCSESQPLTWLSLLLPLSSSRSVFMRDINRCRSGIIPRITTLRSDGIGEKAFTLIELLVVVLIIGILAAVAVPQYQKAVEKTRVSEAKLVLKRIADAQRTYYMANGQYAADLKDLGLEIPASLNFKYYATGMYTARGSIGVAVRLPEDLSYELAIFDGKEGFWCLQLSNIFASGKNFCLSETNGHSEIMPSGMRYYLLR